MKIDWVFAARVAKRAAGEVPGTLPPPGLDRRSEDAAERVIAATGMQPTAALPKVEWVSRDGWIDANLQTMSTLLDSALERAPTPRAAPLADTLGSGLLALEIASIVAMLSRRVLGQFEIDMLNPQRAPRLLLVAPNLEAAVKRMGVPRDDFLTWVLLHEVTHAVQFGAVEWLRDDLGAAMRDLLKIVEIRPKPAAVLKMRRADLRRVSSSLREGGLAAAVLGPERREMLDRIQGRMGLVEGHAEWTMDAAAGDAIANVGRLRAAMTQRRGQRDPLLKLIDRLLGMDLKMRQYEQGKAFCDSVVARRGREGLTLAWSSAQAVPSVAELGDPDRWLRRMAGESAAAA